MKNKLTLILFLVFNAVFCVTLSASALNLQNAFGVSDGSATDPLDSMANTAGYEIDVEPTSILDLISVVIQTLLSLLGVVFLVLLIYGGFLWMSARGNEQQVEKAKEVIYSAIIGLIIVLAAYAITYFVVANFSKDALVPSTGVL